MAASEHSPLAAAGDTPLRIVVMGVSGCGKSTVGRLLADALGLHYVEGDELHPPRNVALMASGVPLTDADRHGWLQAVGERLAACTAAGQGGAVTQGPAGSSRPETVPGPARTGVGVGVGVGVVVTCSALKRMYRDQLRAAAPGVRFVYLHGARALLEQRMAARQGHYMPTSLLQSQLDTLEPPGADEHALAADIDQPPQALVAALIPQLQQQAARP